MSISMEELVMIKQAVSTVAFENEWNEEKQQELFHEAVSKIIESRVKVSKKKRHRQ